MRGLSAMPGLRAGIATGNLPPNRANAARRLLHQYGVRPGQIVEVRGFADQKPIDPAIPNSPRNRRVSIVVRFQSTTGDGGRAAGITGTQEAVTA